MRLPVILLLLAAGPVCLADTIVLKNGKRIVAENVRESEGRIEYQVGDNTFAIPKSLVERVEEGGALPAGTARSTAGEAGPEVEPGDTMSASPDLSIRLVRNGRLDRELLSSLDRSSDPETAAAAYFEAAKFEQDHGNRDQALTYYQRALGLLPNNSTVMNHYASLLVKLERAKEAVPIAERSTRLAPNSADSWMVLGFAYFSADRNPDAIKAFRKSLSLRQDATVQWYLDKALREQKTEAEYVQRYSGHFTLRYEGKQNADNLTSSVLQTLEAHYADLANEFGSEPRGPIPVVLYTDQGFFDVTQSPAWTGALNDGKIRIPVSGISSMTPELSRMLRHELAHSFINELSKGRCPQWLHEGIAQLMEGRTAAPYGMTLSKLFAEQHQVPMNLLENSFMNLNTEEASVAYAQSLAVTEYIRDTYGMSELRRILERIGEGASTEAALRASLHVGYAKLELDVASYLRDRYGS